MWYEICYECNHKNLINGKSLMTFDDYIGCFYCHACDSYEKEGEVGPIGQNTYEKIDDTFGFDKFSSNASDNQDVVIIKPTILDKEYKGENKIFMKIDDMVQLKQYGLSYLLCKLDHYDLQIYTNGLYFTLKEEDKE